MEEMRFYEFKGELKEVRRLLLTMTLDRSGERLKELEASLMETTSVIDNSIARMLNDGSQVEEKIRAVVLEIKDIWEAFKKTRDEEILPALHEGRFDDATKLASGVQEERYRKFISIAELVDLSQSLERMAYHDYLTGLPNRPLFIDRLDQVLLRGTWRNKNVAVLFLDLNNFKIINDTFGHAFGDELLKVVARRLQGCLRAGDTVARLGGDEFTILLQDLAKVKDILMVLEKILDIIKQPIEIKGEEVVVGISIGVSIFPDDGNDSDTLLKNADTAMYRAKSEGNNNFQLYTQAMLTKAIGIP
ncbi:MAG: GGDEF domain-containing protein [Thermodesulfovibrionales bacterium]